MTEAAAGGLLASLPDAAEEAGRLAETSDAQDGPARAPARVLVIVPARDEQQSLGAVLTGLRELEKPYDVLVVDDGSLDDTARVARSHGVRVLQLPFSLGVGGAMRAGFVFALANGYDAAVQVDADGQHDPTYIPDLLAALDEADVVIGARFAGAGAYKARGPRRWAMRLLARVLSRLAHQRLTDVTSGFRATNRRGLALFARHYPAEYLGDTVESLVIALRAGCRVTQVPVPIGLRNGGTPSQSPGRSALYLARAALALFLASIRKWPDATGPEPTNGAPMPQERQEDP